MTMPKQILLIKCADTNYSLKNPPISFEVQLLLLKLLLTKYKEYNFKKIPSMDWAPFRAWAALLYSLKS